MKEVTLNSKNKALYDAHFGITKKPVLPVLAFARSKDCILETTNFDIVVSSKTDLDDGYYKIVGNHVIGVNSDLDWVSLEPFKAIKTVILPQNVWPHIVEASKFSEHDSTLRPTMSSVYIASNKHGFEITATDATFLFYKKYSFENDYPAWDLMIPLSVIKIAKTQKQIEAILFSDEYARLVFKDFEVTFKLIDGKFLNYKAVIPTTNDKEIQLPESMNLPEVISNLIPFANSSTQMISCFFEERNMFFYAFNLDEEISRESKRFPLYQTIAKKDHSFFPADEFCLLMPVMNEQAKCQFAFNGVKMKLLLSCLFFKKKPFVYLYWQSDTRALLFSANRFKELPLPKSKKAKKEDKNNA